LNPIWIKYALIVALLTNLSYWVFLFVKLLFQREGVKKLDSKKSISLIVCIKNGEDQLSNTKFFLNALKNSDELILVDDFSTDNTLVALNQIIDKRVRVISAPINQNGKKMALKAGIENAKNEFIILTDIDCRPMSDNWTIHLRNACIDKTKIVLGYGAYKKLPGYLNAFIRHETLMTAMQYMSYALAGMPYMGVGRNLAYRKEVFENSDKFESHKDLASGDDDLFIAEVANSINTSICLNPDSFTISDPVHTVQEFFQQKARHITTSTRYRWRTKLLLSLYSASHILSYLLTFVLLIYGEYATAILFYLLRMGISWYIYAGVAKRFEEKDLSLRYPILDFSMFIYYLVLSPFLIFQKTEW